MRMKCNWLFLYRLLPLPKDIVFVIFRHLPKYYTVKRVKQVIQYRTSRRDKYVVKHKVR